MTATLQEYADDIVAPEFRQPLKTLEEACKANGWEYVDSPKCCGKPIVVHSFLGPYFATCEECGRFARDVSAPQFGNGCAFCVDSDKVDVDTDVRWISGIAPRNTE